MAVHAHPDDEASKGAATMARYAADGHRVRVVTATGGERGSVLNPRLQGDPEVEANMVELRRKEMAASAEALGIEHAWLGFVDSGLPEGDPLPPLPEGCFALEPDEVVVGALVAQIREFRPHVMTTYDENGGYPHPDHVRVHEISMLAFDAAADPEQFPEAGPAWAVQKVYYDVSFSGGRIRAVHEALLERGAESPFAEWIERRERRDEDAGVERRPATAAVHVAEHFAARDAALRAHATQIDPDGFFFSVPRDLEAQVWPVEEFELVLSRVPVSDAVEDDLFAGVVPEGLADGSPVTVLGADLAGAGTDSDAMGTGHGSDRTAR
ncbi:mycothiol conjugate amidase Mca [Georgenia sp. Z1344]|uniref:mycothiol conjugate amidase Mca n=1 Tax=Georgenia sp. Z1344 TaxID=3416706 RepID=UPI003CEC4CE0